MSWDVGMPNLGHTMVEGTLAQWLKPIGGRVASGEVIATVESDKATFDVEAPADGVLLAIHVPAGSTVPIGTIIGVVGQPGEAVGAVATSKATPTPAAPVASAVSAPPPPRTRANASPAARSLAAELGIDLAAVTGTGEGGRVSRDDVRAFAAGLPK